MAKTGRPPKYKLEYCKAIRDFFSVEKTKERVKAVTTGKNEFERTDYETVANELPTFAKFARSIGVNGDTVVEWAKNYKEFSAAYNDAKELQKEFLVDNGLMGLYPPASFIFTAKNITDMRDKIETDNRPQLHLTGLEKLTDEQLDALIKKFQNSAGKSAGGEG